jgi:hypothetical protein
MSIDSTSPDKGGAAIVVVEVVDDDVVVDVEALVDGVGADVVDDVFAVVVLVVDDCADGASAGSPQPVSRNAPTTVVPTIWRAARRSTGVFDRIAKA